MRRVHCEELIEVTDPINPRSPFSTQVVLDKLLGAARRPHCARGRDLGHGGHWGGEMRNLHELVCWTTHRTSLLSLVLMRRGREIDAGLVNSAHSLTCEWGSVFGSDHAKLASSSHSRSLFIVRVMMENRRRYGGF